MFSVNLTAPNWEGTFAAEVIIVTQYEVGRSGWPLYRENGDFGSFFFIVEGFNSHLKSCHILLNINTQFFKKKRYIIKFSMPENTVTRMHSSRMRTDRGSSHLGGGGRESIFFGAGLPCQEGRPPSCGQSDACENITFPHTTYAVGKNVSNTGKLTWLLCSHPVDVW